MHADDHTLIISVDGRGEIRRARTASLGSNINQEEEFSHLEIYHALDKCDNIVDAFNVFLKLLKNKNKKEKRMIIRIERLNPNRYLLQLLLPFLL